MKKLHLIWLIALTAMTSGACYKKAPNSNLRATENSVNVSTVKENPVETAKQTDSGGDFNQAMDFYRANNYEKAAAEFTAVVKNDSKNQPAHFYLGKSFQALKKTDDAIGAYKKAVELKPEDADANFELGSIYVNRKDYKTSLPYMQKAAKISYKNPTYLIALGDNYRELSECRSAVPLYGNATNFDEKNPAAYYGMGLCYIELNNRIAAQQQLSRLEKLDKNLAKSLADKIPK